MKTAIIGMGNMGCKYAELILTGQIPCMELAAITRIKPEKMENLKQYFENEIPVFADAADLFAAVDNGSLQIDAVLVVTPHYAHEEQTICAFQRGIHVLCDKPSGVYSRQARNMEEALPEQLCFGMIFHQRTLPVYMKIRELVQSGKYGAVKRVNWVVTDWYRPNSYYTTSAWRATWAHDGGGTLLNQCPHNLDLLQWICGMPAKVQAFCHPGKYHPIEVEDEVTAYMEWDNGATGVFIASTGEAPGVNRLEISMDDALLVCENGQLKVCELKVHEPEYRRTSTDYFGKPQSEWKTIACGENKTPYVTLLSNFADAILTGKGNSLIAPGTEGRKSLVLSNAFYLSSWENRMVQIPAPGTEEEFAFERAFEEKLIM